MHPSATAPAAPKTTPLPRAGTRTATTATAESAPANPRPAARRLRSPPVPPSLLGCRPTSRPPRPPAPLPPPTLPFHPACTSSPHILISSFWVPLFLYL